MEAKHIYLRLHLVQKSDPAKLSFRMESQVKCFPDKVKLKEFIFTKPLLYEMLMGLMEEKEEDKKYEQ